MPITVSQDEIRPTHRFGGLLRQRNFGLLWTGETISETGSSMAVVGVPLLAVAILHASTFSVSALTAAAYLPWLLIGLPVGALVDRFSPRPIMIICDIVSALLYASLSIAAWVGVLTIGQVLAVTMLAGAANVFFVTAFQVYLPALVTPGELMEGNAKLQGSMSVATIGGRGPAGLAAQAVGDAAALLFNAGSFLVSATCLLLIRTRRAPREPVGRSTTVRAEIFEGAQFTMRDSLLRPMTLYAAVANLANSGIYALVVVFLIRVAGFNSAAVGLLMATTGVGGIVGAVVSRRVAKRLGTAYALLLGMLGSGLFALLIPLTAPGPEATFYIVGSAVQVAGQTIGNVILASFRQAYCPPSMLGRVTASQRFLVYGTIPLGALTAGGLGTALGIHNALWAMCSLYALSGTVLLTRAIRADKSLPETTATFT